MYTGKIVGSVTLSAYDRQNEENSSESQYYMGSANFTWMPMTKLLFFLKYRHMVKDADNPDSVTIKVSDQQIYSAWPYEEMGTIQFALEGNYSQYFIYLTDGIIDTLKFDLAQRKSTMCCGMVIYSTKTFLNGIEIENSEVISIIK